MELTLHKHAFRLAVATATAGALLLVPSTAMAKGKGGGGGGGGGGTPTVTVGRIKPAVSAAVTCTGDTSMGLTVQRGRNDVVERVMTISGAHTGGWWDFKLTDDTTGRGLVVSGSTMSDLGTAVAVITTSTGSTVQPGVWPLSFTATRRDISATPPADTSASPVLETCTAHLTVVAV